MVDHRTQILKVLSSTTAGSLLSSFSLLWLVDGGGSCGRPFDPEIKVVSSSTAGSPHRTNLKGLSGGGGSSGEALYEDS